VEGRAKGGAQPLDLRGEAAGPVGEVGSGHSVKTVYILSY
jgi:ABC-type microcin C transport system duplicated ATPase subunit YejF